MTFRKSRCYNGGKQHKFQPRYSEKQNTNSIKIKGPGALPRNLLYFKEYLFDICEWCGKKVKLNT